MSEIKSHITSKISDVEGFLLETYIESSQKSVVINFY